MIIRARISLCKWEKRGRNNEYYIHPIHRFKSSDWLKEVYMTWIIFDTVHVWKLIHVCYVLLFPWLLKKLSQLPNLELDSLLSKFYDSVRTKKSMNGVYKTNIDCSFIRWIVEIIVPLVKFNLDLLFTLAQQASVNSRPRFTSGTIIFHHSPHEQSIFVYCHWTTDVIFWLHTVLVINFYG